MAAVDSFDTKVFFLFFPDRRSRGGGARERSRPTSNLLSAREAAAGGARRSQICTQSFTSRINERKQHRTGTRT